MLMSCLTFRGQFDQQTSASAFPLAEMAGHKIIASFKLQALDWFNLVVCNNKYWVGYFF